MKQSIVNKLDVLTDRYEELGALLSDNEVISDQNKFRTLSKEYSEIEPVVKCYERYCQTIENIDEAQNLLKDGDEDMREMAQEELAEAQSLKADQEAELQVLLLPRDPNDSHNVFLEVRAGTGGDEAAIFAGDLFRMYSHYAENMGWKVLEKGESAERVLTQMARNLTNKLIHTPSIQMKKAGAAGREDLVAWTHDLFDLNLDQIESDHSGNKE